MRYALKDTPASKEWIGLGAMACKFWLAKKSVIL
jgi:hypothetical protein